MSVRMKLTHSKTASRRAHHKKDVPHLVATKTGVRRRHFADPDTGMYRGKQIISVGEDKSSKTTNKKDVEKSAKHKKEKKVKKNSQEESIEKK